MSFQLAVYMRIYKHMQNTQNQKGKKQIHTLVE